MKKQVKISYEQFKGTSELPGLDQELIVEAWKVAKKAYAPYSKFRVGAALRLHNGKVITGSNQENIAYPSGLCAERVALFYAGANFPDEAVDTIAIVADGDLIEKGKLISPCGSCRQVMVETEGRQKRTFRVILVNSENDVLLFNAASDLLPLTFGR